MWGGKTFRSNGKHPGDVRIAPIADPLDSEVWNRNDGTIDVPSSLFLRPRRFQPNHWRPDTHGGVPPGPVREAPAAATLFASPDLNPEVSLRPAIHPPARPDPSSI